MKSALEINKEAVRAVEQRITEHHGVFIRNNYGKDEDKVGIFSGFMAFSVHGTAMLENLSPILSVADVCPVQTCTVRSKERQELRSNGDNYRLAPYGRRLARHPETGEIEYQELQETAPNWEEWVTLYKI